MGDECILETYHATLCLELTMKYVLKNVLRGRPQVYYHNIEKNIEKKRVRGEQMGLRGRWRNLHPVSQNLQTGNKNLDLFKLESIYPLPFSTLLSQIKPVLVFKKMCPERSKSCKCRSLTIARFGIELLQYWCEYAHILGMLLMISRFPLSFKIFMPILLGVQFTGTCGHLCRSSSSR